MQSGLAAGAGTLALGGQVVAAQDAEHYVVASDFHWGSPFASQSKSVQFIQEEVPSLDPDVLVLAGDIYEQWWRGMVSSALDIGRASAQLEQLQENGTDVVLVAGNHDRWMLRVGEDASEEIAPGEPWEISEEFYFESGGTEFVAVHGDEGDDLQRNPLSEWLCRQTDEFGTFLLSLLRLISGQAVVGETGSTRVRGNGWQSVSLAHQYDDPVVVPTPLGSDTLDQPRVRTTAGLLGTGGFEMRLDSWAREPADSPRVDYLVFERGHHLFGPDVAATVDRVSADDRWQSVTFSAPFDEPPAVFAAVQNVETAHEDSPPVGRASQRRRAGRSNGQRRFDADARAGGGDIGPVDDPVSVQVRNVTQMGFELRLAAETEPVPHEIGFVAMEPGRTVLGDGLVEVGVPGVTGGGALAVEFDGLLDDPDQIIAAPQSTTTGVGPTLTRLSAQAGEASMSVVAGDGSPVSETVGYLAAGDVGHISARSSTAVASDPDALLEEEWASFLESDHVIAPDEVPETAPDAGLLDPLFVSHQGTRETLLDMFDEFVVFGHTHRPDLGERYVNSGSWTDRSPSSVPQNTYVEIDQGDITVWDWTPGGREPVFQS